MENYTLKVLPPEQYALWDDFVASENSGTVFHTTEWLLRVYGTSDVNLEVLAIYNDKKEIVAGFAFGFKTFLSLKVMVAPPATPYCSPLIKSKKTTSITKQESYSNSINELIIKYLESKLKLIKITFPKQCLDIRFWNWKKYDNRVLYTYTASVSDTEALISKFDSDIKRRAKKAKELAYKFCSDNSDIHISDFFSLQNKTMEKQQHKFPLSETTFIDIMRYMMRNDVAKIYTIYFEDTPVASCVVLLDKSKAYYWLAGSDPEYLKLGFNQLLFVKMIEQISALGVQYFDFVGANTPSIARYKSTFNMNLQPYFQIEKKLGILKSYFALKKYVTKQ